MAKEWGLLMIPAAVDYEEWLSGLRHIIDGLYTSDREGKRALSYEQVLGLTIVRLLAHLAGLATRDVLARIGAFVAEHWHDSNRPQYLHIAVLPLDRKTDSIYVTADLKAGAPSAPPPDWPGILITLPLAWLYDKLQEYGVKSLGCCAKRHDGYR